MIKEAIERYQKELQDNVKLVAVSKTKPVEAIKTAYDSGQRIFGENRAQELAEKAEQLPNDIQWHMVGHIQTKQIKYIAPYVDTIHSIDKWKTLEEVNKRAEQNERQINVLLQFHIAQEESKFGLDEDNVETLLENSELKQLKHVKICGVMGMATLTDDKDQIRKEFKDLSRIYSKLKDTYFVNSRDFIEISMGMTNDYPLAIEAGSTMIRIGSDIFGARG